MKLSYPAVFYTEDSGAYSVVVPDLPGCATGGQTLAEAMFMAVDAASGWVLTELEEGKPVPAASAIADIEPDDATSFISMIALDMDEYAARYGTKAVRKNLTIPAWLNTFAMDKGYNFSQILQEALTEKYEVAVRER
jgi:predicted RNase H-like HicB family nuclease